MPQFTYLNIDLQIERSDTDYRVQVISSPAGQASQPFTLPFQPFELDNFLLRLGHTRRRVRRIDSPEVEAAKTFGSRLFRAVFEGEVRDCLRVSLDEAQRNDARLRIRLRLSDAPELANLPWEYLYEPAFNRFIALSVNTPLVRYIELPERVRPFKVTPPLRVLTMISSPSTVVPLDVEQEWTKLREALANVERRNLVSLERLEQATLPALQRRLRQQEYHVFHFIGHGGFDGGLQDGVLVLEDEHGRGSMVSSQQLGTILHDHASLRLVVLNACEGARTADNDPFAGTAQSLVQQGVPAVVAMQFEITDEAAITFAQEFYSAIADNYPVDAAVTEARKLIFTQGNGLEWATPVLFMRSPDGYIFDVAPSGVTPSRPRAAAKAPDDEQRQQQLGELYTRALSFFYTERWQQAIDLLQEIVAQRSDYEDAASKLESAKRQLQLAEHYAEGIRAADAEAWGEAVRHFEAVQQLDAAYKDSAAMLVEARRQKQLGDLYAEARRLHAAQAWAAVVNIGARIQQLDREYPDAAGLVASARDALESEEQQRRAGALYQQAIRSMNAGAWLDAQRQLQEVQRIAPEYEATTALLRRVEQELSPPVKRQPPPVEQEVTPPVRREPPPVEQKLAPPLEHQQPPVEQKLVPPREPDLSPAEARVILGGDEQSQHRPTVQREAPQKRSRGAGQLVTAAVVVAILLVGVWFVFRQTAAVSPAAVSPGSAVPTMTSWEHVSEPVNYSTNPPTSGDHWDDTASWGIYDGEYPPDELLVHNLQHGAVIISYNPNQVDGETVAQLEELTRALQAEINCIILTPRGSIQDDKPIALTAWGWLALLDGYDEAAIRAFWRDHVAKGPESDEGSCG